MTSPSMRLAAALLALTTAMLAPTAAAADEGDDSRRGSCSNGAEWEIKVKPDEGRIEVAAEVDSDTTGQRWVWVLRHNGSLSARGVGRTRGGGSFEVERTTVDVPGVDTFRFRATRNRAVCVATISH